MTPAINFFFVTKEMEDPADFINAWFDDLKADLRFDLRVSWHHEIRQFFRCSKKYDIPPVIEPGSIMNMMIDNSLEKAFERSLFEDKVEQKIHENCHLQVVSKRKLTVAPNHLMIGLESKHEGPVETPRKVRKRCNIPEFLDLGPFRGEFRRKLVSFSRLHEVIG